jgi:hypothetical protein
MVQSISIHEFPPARQCINGGAGVLQEDFRDNISTSRRDTYPASIQTQLYMPRIYSETPHTRPEHVLNGYPDIHSIIKYHSNDHHWELLKYGRGEPCE